MRKRYLLFLALVLIALSTVSQADEWVRNVKVTRVGTYQNNVVHFMWLSQHPVADCQLSNPSNPVLNFSESDVGGKSLLSVLMAATMARANVDVKVSGCNIVEVYLNQTRNLTATFT